MELERDANCKILKKNRSFSGVKNTKFVASGFLYAIAIL